MIHFFPLSAAAEVYADALAAQPDRLIEAWETSAERTILSKKVEAIHSGQGSINDVVAKADQEPSALERMGFHQQAPFYVQSWQVCFSRSLIDRFGSYAHVSTIQLLYRQIKVYLRNPIMSTSRFLAGIVTALFFGGAFWMLPRNTSGFLSRENQAFAYMLMVPGYGSAVVAYWVEKRKAYYHEEAAGYYHRLAHLLVMFFVEWIFVSAVMVCLGGLSSSSSCGTDLLWLRFPSGHHWPDHVPDVR